MRRAFIAAAMCAWGAAAAAQPARLLILNKTEATLAIVDPGSGAVLGRVPTGDGPHEVAVSDDGRWAFTSNYGTGQAPGRSISMIDLAAMKETRRVDISPLSRPHGLWFSGGKLYFTAEADRKVARYDPATNRVDWQFETGQNATHMVALTRDGRTLVTANISSNSVSIVDVSSGSAPAQVVVPVGAGPEGFDLTPDGRQIWVAHSRDGGVSVIDVAARNVIHTIAAGTKRSNRLKITPDGRLALVSDLDAGELVVIDTATRTIARRLPIGRMAEGILIPDNTRAFVAANGDDFVVAVDLKTWQVTRKIEPGRGPDGLAWAR
jgi:YVTN family beta-propeller protein